VTSITIGDNDASASLDPDETILVCRDCGVLFVGRVGWQPICLHCWRTAREALIAGHAGTRP
jgi:hypothetical protein